MSNSINSVITGTGSFVPEKCIRNEDFLTKEFFDHKGERLLKENKDIIEKFFQITGIKERRYIKDDLVTSDIASYAAANAIESAGIDKEELDYIILAHNFGDVLHGDQHSDIVPSLASRVKHKLNIENPETVAYDALFGCPGWLEGMIQADAFIKCGMARRIMVIGAESLSRVSDPHDIDSMLYADGAGAVILEARESEQPIGIIGHNTRSDTLLHCNILHMGTSYNPAYKNKSSLFLKMQGHGVYKYALATVPDAIKACLEKCNTPLSEISKIFIHQANGKMDEAILQRLYKLFDNTEMPDYIMPMTVEWLGNSSVATLPTLFDLVSAGKLNGYNINSGDTLVFASVGAGMNINAMVYRSPWLPPNNKKAPY